MFQLETPDPAFLMHEDMPRPTSAPPYLENHKFSASNLFAFPPGGFGFGSKIDVRDIRCDEQYQEFYRIQAQRNPSLPKPLEEDQFFLDLVTQRKLSRGFDLDGGQLSSFKLQFSQSSPKNSYYGHNQTELSHSPSYDVHSQFSPSLHASPKMQRLTASMLQQIDTPSFECKFDPELCLDNLAPSMPPTFHNENDDFFLNGNSGSSLTYLPSTFNMPYMGVQALQSQFNTNSYGFNNLMYQNPQILLPPIKSTNKDDNEYHDIDKMDLSQSGTSPSSNQDKYLFVDDNKINNNLFKEVNKKGKNFKFKDKHAGEREKKKDKDALSPFNAGSRLAGSPHSGDQSSKGKVSMRTASPRSAEGASTPTSNLLIDNFVFSDQYLDHVVAIAKDQAGCRMLQKKLDEGNEAVTSIFDEMLPQIVDLMVDPFGNYLCQKLMEVCDTNQLHSIIDKVSNDLVKISLNMHGTRAVQKLIEVLNTPEHIVKVVETLKNCVVCLVKDLNGNHVIQKCLNSLSSKNCNFIYDAIIENCVDVATHRHGCCVLQRCIDTADKDQRKKLIDEICKNSLQLVQDAFGNYVVQYILNLKEPQINGAVVLKLWSNIAVLSKQKFSSNVIEKCLLLGTPDQCKMIVQELLQSGPETLRDLLLDSFANYVVQRALNVAEDPEFGQLLDGIRPHLEDLKSTQAGKRIMAKLVKKYPQLSTSESSDSSHGASGDSPLNSSSRQNNNNSPQFSDMNRQNMQAAIAQAAKKGLSSLPPQTLAALANQLNAAYGSNSRMNSGNQNVLGGMNRVLIQGNSLNSNIPIDSSPSSLNFSNSNKVGYGYSNSRSLAASYVN